MSIYSLQRYKEAIVSFEEALRRKSDCIQSIWGRGFSFLGLKQYEKAMTDFDRVLEKDLKDLEVSEEEKKLVDFYQQEAWRNRGTALYSLQRYEEAIVSFEEALSRKPSALLFYNIGCCYTLQGETEKAIASLKQAIALDIAYLETAKTDADFESIRELPEFQRIMATNL